MAVDRIAAFLTGVAGRAVVGPDSMQSVSASDGRRTVHVTLLSPEGWQADSLQRQTAETDQLRFVYRRHIYSMQPSWTSWFDFYSARLSRYINMRVPAVAVCGGSESPSCLERSIPWSDLDADH